MWLKSEKCPVIIVYKMCSVCGIGCTNVYNWNWPTTLILCSNNERYREWCTVGEHMHGTLNKWTNLFVIGYEIKETKSNQSSTEKKWKRERVWREYVTAMRELVSEAEKKKGKLSSDVIVTNVNDKWHMLRRQRQTNETSSESAKFLK